MRQKIMAVFDAIDAWAQQFNDTHWEPLMRELDRYARRGRHHDRPGSVSGFALVRDHAPQTLNWWQVFETQGIKAAIALNLGVEPEPGAA